MDEQQRDSNAADEQQVDDLELTGDGAEQVKGGAVDAFVENPTTRAARAGAIRGLDGVEHQHNETLVRA